MEDQWDVEIDPAIAEWLAQSRSSLAAEIESLAGRRDLDVQVLRATRESGRKEIAAVLLATAAVIKALNPLILAAIRARFPDAVIEQDNGARRKKLKIKARS